jgi:hypothetical protein
MRIKLTWWISLITLAAIFIACGGSGKKSEKADTPEGILNSIDYPDIKKTSKIETYVGQSLYEYIDGGAEAYHQYNFVEVSTAAFDVDGIELTADVYKFDNSDDAYGMYSVLRPEDANVSAIGVEGFESEASFDFVKGSYLVRIISYEVADGSAQAIRKLVSKIADAVPGTTYKPEMFTIFPADDKIPHSERIIAKSYLAQSFLTEAYTVKYSWEADTAEAFIMPDETGEKFVQWSEAANIDADAMKSVKDIPYDSSKVFVADNPYYGKIIAGLKDGKLIGIIGYKDNMKSFLADWLQSLVE